MSAGFNDHDTPVKCENFRNLLHLQLIATQGIRSKYSWARERPYFYVDCNAGPGVYDQEGLRDLRTSEVLKGSPLVFLEEIRKFGFSFRASFIEESQDMFDRLLSNLSTVAGYEFVTNDNENYQSKDGAVHLYRGSNADFADAIGLMKWRIGTVYHDPNNPPDFDLLRKISQNLPQTDLIVNINANGKKRKDGVLKKAGGDTTCLEDEIKNVGKTRRLITDTLTGKWQWLMMLATNADKDTIREWKSRGLIDADSEQGQNVIKRATYTIEELDAMSGQLRFFDLPDLEMHLTETMPSI